MRGYNDNSIITPCCVVCKDFGGIEYLKGTRFFYFGKEKEMDLDELLKYLLTPVAQVALIIGLAEVIKRMNLFSKSFIPLVDIVLGLASGILVYGYMLDYGVGIGIIIGIAEGLSACGLFSGIKNVKEGFTKSDTESETEESETE